MENCGILGAALSGRFGDDSRISSSLPLVSMSPGFTRFAVTPLFLVVFAALPGTTRFLWLRMDDLSHSSRIF